MQLRHFQTRLAPEHLEHDQAMLNHFLETVHVRKTSTQFVPGETDFWSILVFYEANENGHAVRQKAVALTESDLSEDDRQLLAALKVWRRDQAVAQNVPEYLICPNSALIGVAKIRPQTPGDLSAVKGFGEAKVARYGGDIIAVVNAFGPAIAE
jgi:superfamily II DNA helicase RecQ